jgi:5-hydroxyisourate hydrolase-like protein (transthyretin family)
MRSLNNSIASKLVMILLMFVFMACSKSNSPASTTTVNGSVSAPGGALAFNPPSALERFAYSIFATRAEAGVSGVVSVGGGIDIELIEVDADGTKVGATIVSTTTESDGSYTLEVPASHRPDSKYVIRATGTTQSMDVRYTGSTNDIDPVTDAVSDLVTTTATDLFDISPDEIVEIKEEVDGIVQNVDPTSLDADALATAIKTEVTSDEELSNQLNSKVAQGSICGNVKDAASNNLENIVIRVADYGDWVTRAKTKTDANGDYCVDVPDGEFIVGALNFTTTSMAASEWWSAGGTAYDTFSAEKVTIASSESVTRDFSLEDGARVMGTVTAGAGGSLAEGAPIEGVKVQLRQFVNTLPMVKTRTDENGNYTINVIPGNNQIEARNQTRFDYASEMYDGATGTYNRSLTEKLTLTQGSTTTIDFTLEKGYKISGQVLDGPAGNPVAGMRVRIDSSGASFRMRTDKQGRYKIWLMPRTYRVMSYGQKQSNIDLSASNQTVNFDAQVGTLEMTLKDTSGNGASQVKVFLYDLSSNLVSQELTNSDGTTKVYAPTTGNYKLFSKVTDDLPYASIWYDGQTTEAAGAQVSISVGSTTNQGDITLPDAGLLSITVTQDGSTLDTAPTYISIYDSSDNRFTGTGSKTDGTAIIAIPAGTYAVGSLDASCRNTVVTAGSTTSVNFRTDNSTCY